MKVLIILVLSLGLFTPTQFNQAKASDLNKNCKQLSQFSSQEVKTIDSSLKKAQIYLKKTQTHWANLTTDQKNKLAVKFFGEQKTQRNILVIEKRLSKSVEFLKGKSTQAFRPLWWARSCHPNIDFRLDGVPEGEKVYAAVNWFGLNALEDDFAHDNHIYLSKEFFATPNETVMTILHEVSHLVNGDTTLDNGEEVFVNPKVGSLVTTFDLNLEPKDRGAIKDSAVWEYLLTELASLN